jgi:hypothetical protein
MSHITKHNAKQKGKSNSGKNSWIDLFIVRYSIRVNNLLVDLRERIFPKVSRWNQLSKLYLLNLDS